MSVRLETSPASKAEWRPALGARVSTSALGWMISCARKKELSFARFAPVFMAIGIAVWFSLDQMPDPVISAIGAGFVAVLLIVASARSGFATIVMPALAMVAIGFGVSAARTTMVAAPVVAKKTGAVMIEGSVRAIDRRPDGRKAILLVPERIERLEGPFPAKVRISARASQITGIEAGDTIRLRGVINPPPGPVAPGAFDFARKAWFEGLGGVGFAVSNAEIVNRSQPAGMSTANRMIERLRTGIEERIIARLGGVEGGVAAALLTGKRGAIPEDTMVAIRASGLAHLLAISGLHMALVCGAVFWFVASVLAIIPGLGVRLTVKKWAAGAALVAGFAYFLLAGGSVATERAFIMVAIALCAVLLDRAAITMRNVALAALVVMVLRPEALMDAGFQMSFGATIALVAFYEWVRHARASFSEADGAKSASPAWAIARVAIAVGATTIVATAATGPIAAYHFNQIAAYGLIANLIAVPLVGFVVMPLGLVALVLMPFGLEAIALDLMGMGCGYVISVANYVANLDGSVLRVPAWPVASLALFAIGGLWLCLMQQSWRLLAVFPFAAAAGLTVQTAQPDILVARNGANVAVRSAEGVLNAALPRKERYTIEQWARRDGTLPVRLTDGQSVFTCDSEACIARHIDGWTIAYAFRRSAVLEECGSADILIATVPVRRTCPAPRRVVDLFDLRSDGPYAITLGEHSEGDLEIENVRDTRGGWPWVWRGLKPLQ